MILSNGDKTSQRDKGVTYYTHMIPKGSHKKIRSVQIYNYDDAITGFSFFDKDKLPIWKIGSTAIARSTVEIAVDEVIFGVACKLYKDYQSRFSDF